MTKSLKDENKLSLLAVIIANLAVFYTVVQTDEILGGNWIEIGRGLGEALPASVALVLIGIANSQLSPEAKARIVFLRWNNPVPGCEAFTHHAQRDSRIDLTALEHKYGHLPTDPKEQNRLWYSIYKSVESEPAVRTAHRDFLFTRDYASLALMMVFVLGIAGFFQIPSAATALAYVSLLVFQFLIVSRAARTHGHSFVRNALAAKSAKIGANYG